MQYFSIVGGALAVLFCHGAAAQDFYGSVGLDLGAYAIEDTGDDEGTGQVGTAEITIGAAFDGGVFVELDGRVGYAFNLTDPSENNGLRDGHLLALRFGRDFGEFTLEGFASYMEVTSGDNNDPGEAAVGRYALGIGGQYDVSDMLSVNGLIGFLDGDGSSTPSHIGAFREFAHVAIGVDYVASDDWVLSADTFYGSGVLASDAAHGYAYGVSLEATYQFENPQISASFGVRHSVYQHPTYPEDANETHLIAGIQIDLGNDRGRLSSRPSLPNYLEWIASSDGHLD